MTASELSAKLRALGISEAMETACKLPGYDEATDLVDAGEDMFGRPQKMTAETCAAWQLMRAAAGKTGIDLKLVSAHRSVDYQCRLIRRKLDAGQTLDDILRVNAMPGHSEHHTGRALDLHAGDAEPLGESFAEHPAFDWLNRHAAGFGFYLSYPEDNEQGIDYEPWHWCYHPDKAVNGDP